MNKIALGIIETSHNNSSYEFVVSLPEAKFGLWDPNGEVDDQDIGKPAVVRYDPQDQFCHIVPIEEVAKALDLAAAERLDPSRT